MSGGHRVAVTGVGVQTPLGGTVKEFWDALRVADRTRAARITSFDPTSLSCDYAAEVTGFTASDHFAPKTAKRADRFSQLGLAAALAAWDDAGRPDLDPRRTGVVTGTGYGGMHAADAAYLAGDGLLPRPGPLTVPMVMANATAAHVSLHLPVQGPSLTVVTACAAGAHAVGEAVRLVRDGSADAVLAGASEACVSPFGVEMFARSGALAAASDDPSRSSRPFDTGRSGFVMGEGAGFLLLESLTAARRRGARIYGEVTGYGTSSDGHHLTSPHPDGDGARRAIELALTDADLTPAEITQVNAHATSTRVGDAAEANALAAVFGPYGVPVSAPKGALGHLLGAAGAVEAIAALLSMDEGTVPPTANLDERDRMCPVDASPERRSVARGPVLSNSFGFGGHNAALVFAPVAGS